MFNNLLSSQSLSFLRLAHDKGVRSESGGAIPLTISFWKPDQKFCAVFVQNCHLCAATRFCEAFARKRLAKTRLEQNQRIMELKIVSRRQRNNPIALLFATTPVCREGKRPNMHSPGRIAVLARKMKTMLTNRVYWQVDRRSMSS
jgi:hypothetical protein